MNRNQAATLLISIGALSLSLGGAMAQDSGAMKSMPGMHMDASAAPSGSAAAKLGNLDISGGYVRAMLPGQPVGGGYITIHNGGKADDKLASVTSSAAGKVELHEMKMDGEIMKMREIKGGIAIPAGATVTLAPNTMHMMFKQVKAPFKQGGTVPVMLMFDKAGMVDINLPIVSAKGN
ncbi:MULTISPECIES: copper chaperone PCu(A)C [unclassified Rhizobium]|uniref:copper chaperone PCu(A)C n=1 Tax=unclassified Rhizobium TaxID=2613769 RepID=UPI000EA8AA92|nr:MULTISPECIES: copper chaperone PCu(A)C [unclassified Rhizobium]AYG66360.1 copper chaperone PCu(A)C [Rhizobium sp. CCGE531]AYG72741.1 copper chaperone PCu(A)C [Rhizobium sp. CCGE532]